MDIVIAITAAMSMTMSGNVGQWVEVLPTFCYTLIIHPCYQELRILLTNQIEAGKAHLQMYPPFLPETILNDTFLS